jgi:hypothetical protein
VLLLAAEEARKALVRGRERDRMAGIRHEAGW